VAALPSLSGECLMAGREATGLCKDLFVALGFGGSRLMG
jgi:hypothetical protein